MGYGNERFGDKRAWRDEGNGNPIGLVHELYERNLRLVCGGDVA